jgi:tRNA-2-methylthio-N6-dimethylallyladenosine synthase
MQLPEINRSPESIVEEVKALAGDGVVEVTLLGQTINGYGKGLGVTLADVFEQLNEIDGLERIRFVTSHPLFNTEPIFRAMNELPKVCEYLHLPAQSGSDRILKLMKRGYTASRYREIIDRFREVVPHGELASDWIVGFPTETDEDFQASLDLLQETRPQNSFIFKYSPRPGTHSDDMDDDVPEDIKKQRNQEMLNIQEKISLRTNEARIGSLVEVLVEGRSKNNDERWTGRTRTWRPCVFDHDHDLTGQIVQVRVHSATPLTLMGSVVAEDTEVAGEGSTPAMQV